VKIKLFCGEVSSIEYGRTHKTVNEIVTQIASLLSLAGLDEYRIA